MSDWRFVEADEGTGHTHLAPAVRGRGRRDIHVAAGEGDYFRNFVNLSRGRSLTQEAEVDELFRTWPDGVQETIGREMLRRLMHNPTVEAKGIGQDSAYRNQIRVGWQRGTAKFKILGIIMPYEEGIQLELRVGSEERERLLASYTGMSNTKDRSSNADDKVMIQVNHLPLSDEFDDWVRAAYAFVAEAYR